MLDGQERISRLENGRIIGYVDKGNSESVPLQRERDLAVDSPPTNTQMGGYPTMRAGYQ